MFTNNIYVYQIQFKSLLYKRYDNNFFTRQIDQVLLKDSKYFDTRYTGSESNKCNGVDTVLEIDEAAKMTGNITNDGSAAANEKNGNDKCRVSLGYR